MSILVSIIFHDFFTIAMTNTMIEATSNIQKINVKYQKPSAYHIHSIGIVFAINYPYFLHVSIVTGNQLEFSLFHFKKNE